MHSSFDIDDPKFREKAKLFLQSFGYRVDHCYNVSILITAPKITI